MVLLLLGAPGSGKGTQAKLLKDSLQVAHLSTGDMLREAVKNQTSLGKKAADFMQRGQLVPDQLVLDLIAERIQRPDSRNGFILDGYPRNVAQGDALEQLLRANGKSIGYVVAIDVKEADLVARLSGRRTCKSCGVGYHVQFQPPAIYGKCDKCGGELIQRSDDVESVIRERLNVYNSQTAPLLDYYGKKGILQRVVGTGAPEDVLSKIMSCVSSKKGGV